jgi:hypothetical protein
MRNFFNLPLAGFGAKGETVVAANMRFHRTLNPREPF